jgi:hypothetical protein
MPAAAMPRQSGAGASRSLGNIADKALVDPRRAIELPDDVDAGTLAATMNPAMSAWIGLRLRVPIQAGQRVLVLGATGNAGTMAIQVAKLLGAGTVVGAGRGARPSLHGLCNAGCLYRRSRRSSRRRRTPPDCARSRAGHRSRPRDRSPSKQSASTPSTPIQHLRLLSSSLPHASRRWPPTLRPSGAPRRRTERPICSPKSARRRQTPGLHRGPDGLDVLCSEQHRELRLELQQFREIAVAEIVGLKALHRPVGPPQVAAVP